jgi:hypothetical protein
VTPRGVARHYKSLDHAEILFSGAVSVTSFVVASGVRTSGLLVLGFILATLCYGLLAGVIGPKRLARFLLWIAGERQRPRRPSRAGSVARTPEVEQDVISALIQQCVSRRAAAKAAANAKLKAPDEFEPLFKAAVGLLY